MSTPKEPDRPRLVADSPTNLIPHLAAYLAVVDAGSFTGAARQAGSDKSVLSRRVKALEEGLGVRLLNRTTRAIHVTAAGQRLVDEARAPLAEVLEALVRTRAPDQLEGTIRISSAQSLAQAILVPVLAQLRRDHPQLKVELSCSEAMTPIVEEGSELAVRVGRMPDSSLISRKLATWRHVVVASPGWVATHGDIVGPTDLAPHWLLWGRAAAQGWNFERGDEQERVVVDQPALVYDASQLLIESARAGLGVAAMPPFSVTRELASGALVRVLPQWRVAHELGIYGVTPHRTLLPARVRAVLDALRARFDLIAPTWEALTG